ncbi:hypothetical protein SprV_0100210500 [Sparganum proliferum]
MLRQPQLHWSGHLVRMDDERLSKRLFSGNVRRSNLRSQPHNRRQSQKRGTQISIAVAVAVAAAIPQWQRLITFNVSTMSTDILGVNWTCWTPPDQLQHRDRTNRSLSVHPFLAFHAVK